LAELHRPDLILLDIMMPEGDGWAAIGDLQRSDKTSTIPVLAVTAKEEAGLRERLRGAGFCAYLKKPFFPSEAMGAVERCLDGGFVNHLTIP
ncbi:MAG: response regulator, partial [Gemmatimonadota bacterium]